MYRLLSPLFRHLRGDWLQPTILVDSCKTAPFSPFSHKRIILSLFFFRLSFLSRILHKKPVVVSKYPKLSHRYTVQPGLPFLLEIYRSNENIFLACKTAPYIESNNRARVFFFFLFRNSNRGGVFRDYFLETRSDMRLRMSGMRLWW